MFSYSVHHGCCPYLCKIYGNHLVYIILVSIQIYIPILAIVSKRNVWMSDIVLCNKQAKRCLNLGSALSV